MLSRAQFLAARPLPRETIDIPDFGQVVVRTLTAGERDLFESEHIKDAAKDFRARLTIATVCDEVGDPLFSADDVPAITALPSYCLDPIVDAAMRLNRLGKDAAEASRKKLRLSPDKKFRMRLALAMNRPLRELNETVGADELVDWRCYEEEYGLPDAYLIAAVLGPLIANVFGGGSKGKLTACDLVPYFRSQALPQSPEVMRNALLGACS